MSLVTRCPACGTAFKVVRDQLRISDGWVRCGRCSEVFDATLDLREAPGASGVSKLPIAEELPAPALTAEAEGAVDPPPSLPNIDLNLPVASAVGRQAGLAPPTRVEVAKASASSADDDVADVQLQKALRRARAKSAKIARAKARGEERAARESAPVVLVASEAEPTVDHPPHWPRLGVAARKTPWRRPGVRRALVPVAVLAAIVLVSQVLRHERDLVAARQPSLRPVLSALCGLTGCELSAPMQINDIVIQGASFSREKTGDAYRLSFSLRSTAPVPLAMPAVELSLLDTQERPVVRRVLMPGEFDAPAILAARAERPASLSLTLVGDEAAALPPVVGFHLLAFYP